MATLKQTVSSDHTTVFNYIETSLDKAKKNTNRLVSICGKYYTVITEGGETIEFKGIRQFNAWAKKNEYVTDF